MKLFAMWDILLLIYTVFVLLCFFSVYVADREVVHPPISVAEAKSEICTLTPLLLLHGVLRVDIVMSVLVNKGNKVWIRKTN